MTTTAEPEKPSVPYRRGAKRKPFAFRLPPQLVKDIDKRARKTGVSRTWMVEVLLNRGLGKDADEMETTENRDDGQIDLFA